MTSWARLMGMLACIILCLTGLISAVEAGNAAETPLTRQVTARASARHPSHVFMILMENHNWSEIVGNPSAPFINHTLIPMASVESQYYNPPHNHPSLPNYIWLQAGTNFGITDDNDPKYHPISSHQHLTYLLDRAHISWKAYEENISGSDCPVVSTPYPYTARHDPFVYFADVTLNQSYCIKHIRPFRQFASDLAKNKAPIYSFITPSVCDDMHDSCPPTQDQVKQGDEWLSQVVPQILTSRAYRTGGVVFITWDEGEGGSDGPIGMLVLSPDAKGGGYISSLHATHSSTLRTVEEILGVRPFLGDAAHSNDLSDMFTHMPVATGHNS